VGSRRLKDLDPSWSEDGDLMFECPVCPESALHIIGVPTKIPMRPGGPVWTLTGGPDFDSVTLSPSIDFTTGKRCSFHGWVRSGEVVW
jgi:hypothetical protein